MEEYRNNYPHSKPTGGTANLSFYQNAIVSRPRGVTITTMHQEWAANYDLLESHHAYIQWLFPLRERSRFNSDAQVLQLHEMHAIQQTPQLQQRFFQSLVMMCNFWGCQLQSADPTPANNNSTPPATVHVVRCLEWKDRLMNTRNHSHNNMRITRMSIFPLLLSIGSANKCVSGTL